MPQPLMKQELLMQINSLGLHLNPIAAEGPMAPACACNRNAAGS